ncbi:MFS transporter [Rhodococcus sp. IC4_135]|uniref:MFS transporter n=1 Tax=Rhodococcus sp. IC4_135 TaxID=2715537 RepID=UPI00141E9A0D|nr:MFS transporter [Rhodococcus sp. IC4_135]
MALTTVMLALSKGAHWGWTARPTLALVASGTVLLIAWVPLELRVGNPLVNVRIAARSTVLLTNASSLLLGFAMFANMLITPQLLQRPTSSGYGLGFDVLDTGLWMAPIAAIFGVMAPVSASLIRRCGPQMTLLAGAGVMAGSYIARVYLSGNLWQIVVGSVLVAAGTSMTYAALPTLIIRAVPVTESASANGLNTLLRYLGTSIASAVLAAVTAMSMTAGESFPTFGAFLAVFWAAAAASLSAALIALVLLGLRERRDLPRTRPGGAKHAAVSGRVVS